jgi:hypothetical protein
MFPEQKQLTCFGKWNKKLNPVSMNTKNMLFNFEIDIEFMSKKPHHIMRRLLKKCEIE